MAHSLQRIMILSGIFLFTQVAAQPDLKRTGATDTSGKSISISRKKIPKINLGLFTELSSNIDISNSNYVSKYNLDVFFLYNPAEKTKVENAMGGNFMIPATGFQFQTNGIFNFGLQVELGINPTWQVIVNGGYFTTEMNTNFPVTLVGSGGSANILYPKDGSVYQKMRGINGGIGVRYNFKGKKMIPFVETNADIFSSKSSVERIAIRTTIFALRQDPTNIYFRLRLGPGLNFRLGNHFRLLTSFQGFSFSGKAQPNDFSTMLHAAVIYVL